MKTLFILIVGLIGGAAAMFVWNLNMQGEAAVEGVVAGGDENSNNKKPLYWVAPMDDAYRRDGRHHPSVQPNKGAFCYLSFHHRQQPHPQQQPRPACLNSKQT